MAFERKIISNVDFHKPAGGEDGFNVKEFAKLMEIAYVGDSGDGPVFKQKKTFSPSTIGYGHGTCPRYWYIVFNGAYFTEQFDAMAKANMENGTMAHTRIQAAMERTGLVEELEVEIVSEDPPIRGFADAIINWKGKKVVGEVKTMKSANFAIKVASMAAVGNHLIQVLIYMKLKRIDQGFLFYENKDDQTFLVLPIDMNERNTNLINYVFNWMREVYSAYENGEKPKRAYTKSTSACKYCPVFDICWSDPDKGEKVIPKMETSL